MQIDFEEETVFEVGNIVTSGGIDLYVVERIDVQTIACHYLGDKDTLIDLYKFSNKVRIATPTDIVSWKNAKSR